MSPFIKILKFISRRQVISFAVMIGLLISIAAEPFETAQADNTYFVLSAGTPLIQDWSDSSQITSNDDWSGVPSINGYRGDGLTGSTNTDPQTILGDGSGTPLNVRADQVNTNLGTGTIAEFSSLADPVVALQPSGTADAPHLDIRLNTVACIAPFNIRVGYRLRDIDTSGDTNQQVALQYRVGTTGNYTNIGSAYVADATNSGNTLETSVAALLPPAARGQLNVHVRVMLSNAPGSDEFVGVDDIAISCISSTAADAQIKGRVLDQAGNGIGHVGIMLTGGGLEEVIYATSNSFGYYQFDGLESGETFVLQALSNRYNFENATMVVSLDEDISDANFFATQLDSGSKLWQRTDRKTPDRR